MPPIKYNDSVVPVQFETKERGRPKDSSETTPLLGRETPSGGASPSTSAFGSTAALAFTMLVQSFLLVGVFPYSGFLAMHLVPTLNEESAGRCAGLLASSFMAGRTLTSFRWGQAADRYGRTFTIRTSLLLSAVFSVLFGLAPTLPLALAARFALGLSNGLIGPIKTIITEMSRGDTSKETRTMGIVMGMWGYGFLVSPAVSGYLADPLKQYPDSNIVARLDTFLDLAANPFLLPNLVGCLFCILGYYGVGAFVVETLPAETIEPFVWSNVVPSFCRGVDTKGPPPYCQAKTNIDVNEEQHLTVAKDDQQCGGDSLPRWVSPSPSTTALTILSPLSSTASAKQTSEEVSLTDDRDKEKEAATIKSLWERRSTRQHLLLHWVYSFLVITVDEAFPLYCISRGSGLGVEEKMIGNLLTGAGAFYILIQFPLLTTLVDRYGFYKAMKFGALFGVPMVCLIPLSLITNKSATEGTLAWSTLFLTSAVYAVMRVCSSITFSTLTMTTNRTVPAHHRAAMNGLSMLGGSLAKAAGPIFAGMLFSESVARVTPPLGSVVVWMVIACMGVGFFVQTLLLPEHVQDDGSSQSGRSINTVQMSEEGANASAEDDPAIVADEKGDRPPSF